jgi:hypothetical protein
MDLVPKSYRSPNQNVLATQSTQSKLRSNEQSALMRHSLVRIVILEPNRHQLEGRTLKQKDQKSMSKIAKKCGLDEPTLTGTVMITYEPLFL